MYCVRCLNKLVHDANISLLCRDCQNKASGLDKEYNQQRKRRLDIHKKITKAL